MGHLVRPVVCQAACGLGAVQPVGLRLQARQGGGGLAQCGRQQGLIQRPRIGSADAVTLDGTHANASHWRGDTCGDERIQQRAALEVPLHPTAAKEGAEALRQTLVHGADFTLDAGRCRYGGAQTERRPWANLSARPAARSNWLGAMLQASPS
jgi:hypothetical protein